MNIFRTVKLPSKVRPGEPVKAEDHNAIVDALKSALQSIASITVQSGAEIGVKPGNNGGIILFIKKIFRGGASEANACPFGEIISIPDTDPAETGIRGGIIYCGDQTWNMDPQTLNLAAPGVWLVSIAVSVEVNRDDDNVIILPGIKTGTRPTGDWEKTVWVETTDYPANTVPVASTGIGVIHVPLGKLTIADGAASFEQVGCGNITLGQCAGTLSHSRG